MDPFIQVKGLKYKTKNKNIIDIDDFLVNRGEFVVIMGPNGAGKTSLLRILSLIQKPTEGEVCIKGQKVTNSKQAFSLRRQMTMLFQQPILLGTSTVFENIAYPLKIRGESRDAISDKVDSAMKGFKIAHLSKEKAWSLSGGEARRVSFARALCFEPQALFLDEPFTFIDGWDKKDLLADVYQFIRQKNITAVYVTNQKEEVIEKCDKLVFLHKGRVVQEDIHEHNQPQESFKYNFK